MIIQINNIVTIKNRYLLSLIIEILDRLSNAKRFTILNLKNAYYRIKIKESNK